MVYPVVEQILTDGSVVEGRGVIPDVAVTVDRDELPAGVDPVPHAAIDYLCAA